MKFVVHKTESGCEFRCTEAQRETIQTLETINRGGIGTVHGYVAKSGRVTPETADIQFITAFSTERLYERKREALENIEFSDIADRLDLSNPKLSTLTEAERESTFEARKQKEVDSLQKTLDGDRSDAHRQAHDRCYCQVGQGIKVHYRTEKDSDGLKQPILVNGLPVVESIMLTILEIKRKVIEPGEYKKVNSGAPVLMSNAIKSVLNKRSVGLKTLSLKEDNFDRIVVDKKEFLPENVEGIPAELFIRP
jgi:hypothetical protein